MNVLDNRIKLLKERVGRLKALLDDPHPGLFTWCSFVAKNVDEINAIMDGKRDDP